MPGFRPQHAFPDVTGIWFSQENYDRNIWHWDETEGLHDVLTDVPTGQYVRVEPAGRCF